MVKSVSEGKSRCSSRLTRKDEQIDSLDKPNSPKNKVARGNEHREARRQNKKIKSQKRRARKAAEARGEKVTRGTPRTIERMRRPDETIVVEGDDEVEGEDMCDEFVNFFNGETTPKLMVTTCVRPTKEMFDFMKEFCAIVPNTHYYKRKNMKLKEMIKCASGKDFTDFVVFTCKNKKIHGMYISHLPEGPTSYFRISSLKLAEEILGGATCTTHTPELIMKNFDTRLGHRIGRQLRSLFPLSAEYHGRRVITFHNQRDFIFFRHYRYVFRKEGTRAALQEIGPRFTLRLRFVHTGTFDTKFGEYEFLWKHKLHVDRKKFYM
eukprot:GHVR01123237.1.p1 GENE.GHVR01123237.1~~GHVR01123237.1.p1  ORF type:complete len:322 (+),score=56.41 GHVR01123237.1:176-1141(+)